MAENLTAIERENAATVSDNYSLRVGHLYTDSRSQWGARSRDRSLANQISFVDGYLTGEASGDPAAAK